MYSLIPKSKVILKYTDIFETESDDPFSLIQEISKHNILAELTALNYRLRPNTTRYQDRSAQKQLEELEYFCSGNSDLYKFYNQAAARYSNHADDFPLMFTRAGCIVGIEEIVQNESIATDLQQNHYPKELILRYLLTVNAKITSYIQSTEEEKTKETIETLNPKGIVLNEMALDVDLLQVAHRGYQLCLYLSNHPQLASLFNNYINELYQKPYDAFIYELISAAFSNNKNGKGDFIDEASGRPIDVSFYYKIDSEASSFFNSLSEIFPNEKPETLLSIRKYPFYKIRENEYLLTDNTQLIEKCYSQLINDFWFDVVKIKSTIPIETYRGVIGNFFEQYVKGIIKFSFQRAKNFKVLCCEELKMKVGKDEKEITDVYIRDHRKIFLAEVKSGSIYDKEKYSGHIDGLYKENRAGFFKSFGIDQLITAIVTLEQRIISVDPTFPLDKSYRIFPAIVVSEKACQTPLMAHIFNQRFQELLLKQRDNRVHIYPLNLIHISDLENIQTTLNKKPSTFWDILQYNVRSKDFVPTFSQTVNQKDIKPNYRNVLKDFRPIIEKYSRSQS